MKTECSNDEGGRVEGLPLPVVVISYLDYLTAAPISPLECALAHPQPPSRLIFAAKFFLLTEITREEGLTSSIGI